MSKLKELWYVRVLIMDSWYISRDLPYITFEQFEILERDAKGSGTILKSWEMNNET